MNEPYLEVTFRRGAILAAYLYLPVDSDRKSVRTERVEPGLVIDFDAQDRAIGIEIVAPRRVSLEDLNRVLSRVGVASIEARDLAPLEAA